MMLRNVLPGNERSTSQNEAHNVGLDTQADIIPDLLPYREMTAALSWVGETSESDKGQLKLHCALRGLSQ